MSSRNRAKRATQRKPATPRAAPQPSSTADEVLRAQHRLDRAAEAFRAAQADRRQAVRKAWSNGAGAIELATLLKISRQKVYEIVGDAPRAKTRPIT